MTTASRRPQARSRWSMARDRCAPLRRWRCSLAALALMRRLHAFVQGALSALALGWKDLQAAPPVAVSSLFRSCDGELVRIRYRWDSRWYTAKLRSQDVDGTRFAGLVVSRPSSAAPRQRTSFALANDLVGPPLRGYPATCP